jgi:hypothetical protein
MIEIEILNAQSLEALINKWSKVPSNAPAAIKRLAQTVGTELLGRTKQKAPRGEDRITGEAHLQDSLIADYAFGSTEATITILSEVQHARFVIEGTAPHIIEARGGGVLVFQEGGTTVFTRRVNHPGTAPNDFGQEALDSIGPIVDAAVEDFTRILFGG